MYFGCTVPPDRKQAQLGNSDQEAFLSAGKDTGVVLVPCDAWKCVSTAISGGVSRSLGVICYNRWEHWGSQKLLQGLVSHELTDYPLHIKLSLPLMISSVNVTKSEGNWGFGHIYWRSP